MVNFYSEEKGDFLAAQNIQERLLDVLTEISKDRDAAVIDASQRLAELYRKSLNRLEVISVRLKSGLPRTALVASFLDQVVAQNNRLLMSTTLSELGQGIDIFGQTAAHFAARSNSAVSLKILILSGIDLYVHDKFRYTLLACAAENGHLKIVKILSNPIRNTGVSPWDQAIALQAAAGGGHLKLVEFLLAHGAVFDATDLDSWRPHSSHV